MRSDGVPAPRRVVVLPDTGGGAPAGTASRIPGLEWIAELGRGAGSSVHHVRREGADYVLKVLTPAPDAAAVVADLRREAARLATVPYPGLPLVREVGLVDGRPYLVSDLVPGGPLAGLLAEGPLPPDVVGGLAAELAGVLAALHRRGIVHGAVTPRNVIVEPTGTARLIDAGLASRRTCRSDLSSLAAVLFECLTGRPPRPSDAGGDVDRAVTRLLAGLARDRPEPVPAAAEADLAAADRAEAAADVALCGRDAELSALADRWHRARGGRGGASLITGPAGIGKSRLVRELAGAARAGGHVVLRVRCSADDTRSTVLPADLCRTLARQPDVERLLGADLATHPPEAVADALVGLARARNGLLLHLDDVHRFDPGRPEVVRALADRFDGTPLLLVATGRSDGADAGGPAAFRAAVGGRIDPDLSLGALGPAGLRELIAAVLPGAGEPLTGRIAARSSGSPAAVVEHLHALVDAGLLSLGWAGWELAELRR